MKPGDHPEFFRSSAPDGRSRESTIRVDRYGHWFHDDEPVEHARMLAALPTWIARHPDDGRWILSNGYDWCYVTVDATGYFVIELDVCGDVAKVRLSDGTEEALDLRSLSIDDDDVVRCAVKGGACEARFTRLAQLALSPWLCDSEPLGIELGGIRYPIRYPIR